MSSWFDAQLLIGGEFVDSMDGGTFETIDPRSGEVLMSVAEATAEDVDRAVKAAREVCLFQHAPRNPEACLLPACKAGKPGECMWTL